MLRVLNFQLLAVSQPAVSCFQLPLGHFLRVYSVAEHVLQGGEDEEEDDQEDNEEITSAAKTCTAKHFAVKGRCNLW